MSNKAVVLLSAGLDSSFNLYKAMIDRCVVLALTFNYGQKSASQEIACSAALARDAGIEHQVVDLPWFKVFTQSSLLSNRDVPQGSEVAIDDPIRSAQTAKAVWVPNRNGIFLNVAAAFAEALGADTVIPGFNAEEAATFPDNTGEFLKALDRSFYFSTSNQVKTWCYSTHMNKTQIVAEGMNLELPFAYLWPCYLDGETWCGQCESCLRYKRALESNGLSFDKLRSEA